MRIIGGELKGKQIFPPSNFRARPTTDFAKEGLFNVLINTIDFPEISVLDLFSGTGGISYEFASRGCSDITSVEMNPVHYNFIKESVKKFDFDVIKVVRHNVFDFIKICNISFDIIFADPPYDIKGFKDIPDKILSANILKNNGLLILEHSSSFNFIDDKRFFKELKYGNVHFSFFKNI